MFLTKLRILVSSPRKPRHLWISCVLKFSNICCFRCWVEDYSSLVCHMCCCFLLEESPPSCTSRHLSLPGVMALPNFSSLDGRSGVIVTRPTATMVKRRPFSSGCKDDNSVLNGLELIYLRRMIPVYINWTWTDLVNILCIILHNRMFLTELGVLVAAPSNKRIWSYRYRQ